MTAIMVENPVFRSSTVAESAEFCQPKRARVYSIDAARGLTMFVMIFVNLLGPGDFIPWWMRHWKGPGSGLTFVDLVFPAFLFIAGMSIPYALLPRLEKGAIGSTALHVMARSASLLMIGVMMVNERPDSKVMGWSGALWEVLMYVCVLMAFFRFGPPWKKPDQAMRSLRPINSVIRVIGFSGLFALALVFRGPHGERLLQLWPFFLSTKWWGILGHIGFAYLIASFVFIAFRTNTTAILACIGLMTAMYSADWSGMFAHVWLAHLISFGGQFGTRPMVTTSGMLLGVMLFRDDKTVATRVKFTLWYVVGFGVAAYLLAGEYGVGKIIATPSWALIGCVATALVWLVMYLLVDVKEVSAVGKPLTLAGANVLLPYILSEMCRPTFELFGIWRAYIDLAQGLTSAIVRTAALAAIILMLSCGLNRAGMKLRL